MNRLAWRHGSAHAGGVKRSAGRARPLCSTEKATALCIALHLIKGSRLSATAPFSAWPLACFCMQKKDFERRKLRSSLQGDAPPSARLMSQRATGRDDHHKVCQKAQSMVMHLPCSQGPTLAWACGLAWRLSATSTRAAAAEQVIGRRSVTSALMSVAVASTHGMKNG